MNCCACNRDPAFFDEPEIFIPECCRTDRIAAEAEKIGVTHLTYGAGRRVCPGGDSKSTCNNTLCFAHGPNLYNSGISRSLCDIWASIPLLHLGTCSHRRGRKEPCSLGVQPRHASSRWHCNTDQKHRLFLGHAVWNLQFTIQMPWQISSLKTINRRLLLPLGALPNTWFCSRARA